MEAEHIEHVIKATISLQSQTLMLRLKSDVCVCCLFECIDLHWFLVLPAQGKVRGQMSGTQPLSMLGVNVFSMYFSLLYT